MAVISALRTAGGAVLRNPVIILVTALFGLIQLPQLLAQAINPVVAGLLSLALSLLMIFVTPFVQDGLIGMANEGIEGKTRFGTFISEGKSHYVPVFGVYLLLIAVGFVISIMFVFGAFIGIGTIFATNGEPSLAVLGVFALLAILVFGAFFLTFFFLQFYVQAIVIENIGAIAGLKHSYRCVRSHLLGTFGYVILATVAGSVFGVFGAVVSILTNPTSQSAEMPIAASDPSLGILLAIAALFVVLSGVFGGFMATYSVAFYREIRVPVSG
ncbi:hypothetical protein SAMN05421858_2919 [Haladaptatus litoreus]|uniref:DUF7847 domain-containing protein n=1 Tax=Haladaptatus litoreus TaxID=553468 RepID=A0A1N7C2V3_9EURY|nr:hypothetical protein [Haladaptatus litoreus]SIR57773.1 hypothetical protein SAMN05421858_2919 [Haladaptatus litoreus]